VQDAVAVQEAQPAGDVARDAPERLVGQRRACAARLLQRLVQAACLAVVHLDVEVAALLPRAVLPHDVRVRRQLRHGADLAQAPAGSGVGLGRDWPGWGRQR
jgi:hypothetical protein